MTPAGLCGESYFSGFALLLPYLEQSATWDLVSRAIQENQGVGPWGDFWYPLWWDNPNSLNAAQRDGFGGISFMRCPTRRSSSNNITYTRSGGQIWYASPGPRGDYAMVTGNETPQGNEWGPVFWMYAGANAGTDGRWYRDRSGSNFVRNQVGAFRGASYGETDTDGDGNPRGRSSTWSARDNFSRFAGGLSNILLVGEKQLHIGGGFIMDGGNRRTVPALMDFTADEMAWGNADGSWLIASMSPYSYGIYRPVIFLGPVNRIDIEDAGRLPGIEPRNRGAWIWGGWGDSQFGFGSWHTGTTNFVLGDGSVRSINDSVNPRILAKLGSVGHGLTVALP